MGSRWYGPNEAQFLSRDSVFGMLQTPVSLNRYTYAFGDPLNYFDPDGRWPKFIDRGVERFKQSNLHRSASRAVRSGYQRVKSATAATARTIEIQMGRAQHRVQRAALRTKTIAASTGRTLQSAHRKTTDVVTGGAGWGNLAIEYANPIGRAQDTWRGISNTSTGITNGPIGATEGLINLAPTAMFGGPLVAPFVADRLGVSVPQARFGRLDPLYEEDDALASYALGTAVGEVAPAILGPELAPNLAAKGSALLSRASARFSGWTSRASARLGQVLGSEVGAIGRVPRGPGGGGTEIVERAMSRAELEATRLTGLVRGEREGTHYVSDAVNRNAFRARQRLSLPETPEVRVRMEVPEGAFSPPKRVDPDFGMPGGGIERTGTGGVPCRILCVWSY